MQDQFNKHSVSRRGVLSGIFSTILTLTGISALAKKPSPVRPWDDKYELFIELELAEILDARPHRPYVAVWIEDKDGRAIRTLSVWMQTGRKGQKYVRDLRRWFRADQDRVAAGGSDLIPTVSSATREAGKYSFIWNGRDDNNKPVEQGEYVVNIEVAREHGTYQLMRKTVVLAAKPLKLPLEANVEVKGASVEYRKRK